MGERIKLDPFAVSHGLRDVGLAMAFEVRAEQRVAAECARLPCDIAVTDSVRIAGRQHQELDARAVVDPEQRIL